MKFQEHVMHLYDGCLEIITPSGMKKFFRVEGSTNKSEISVFGTVNMDDIKHLVRWKELSSMKSEGYKINSKIANGTIIGIFPINISFMVIREGIITATLKLSFDYFVPDYAMTFKEAIVISLKTIIIKEIEKLISDKGEDYVLSRLNLLSSGLESLIHPGRNWTLDLCIDIIEKLELIVSLISTGNYFKFELEGSVK